MAATNENAPCNRYEVGGGGGGLYEEGLKCADIT